MNCTFEISIVSDPSLARKKNKICINQSNCYHSIRETQGFIIPAATIAKKRNKICRNQSNCYHQIGEIQMP